MTETDIAAEVQKLITHGIIDPETAPVITRLVTFIDKGEALPQFEYDRWRELGYLRFDAKARTYYLEMDIHNDLFWSLLSAAWLGDLKREFRDGEWVYKQTPSGVEKAKKLVKRLRDES